MIKQVNNFNFISTPKISQYILDCDDYVYNILVGSVRSGKDYATTIAFTLNVIKSDYDLHMVAAVDVKNAMRIVGRYILDFMGGIAKQVKYQEAPAIRISTNGIVKHIIFVGGKNVGSDSAVRGLTLASVYFTEINLLNMDFIDQAVKRTLTFKDGRRIYGTLNPRGIRDPFILRFINTWQKEQDEYPNRKIMNYKTFTLIDNPIFTEEDIRQIKAGYDPESVAYKRDILGMFADPTDSLYRVKDYNILTPSSINIKDYGEYYTVADFGETNSATVFLLGAFYWNNVDKQRELHILKEYHHINKLLPENQKLSLNEYIDAYVEFIKESIVYMKKLPARILYDGGDETYRNIRRTLLKNSIQLTPKYVLKPPDEERIKTGQSWLYLGKLRFASNCQQAIGNFRDATHDNKHYERTGEIRTLEVFNDLGHLDALDGVNYLIAEAVKSVG